MVLKGDYCWRSLPLRPPHEVRRCDAVKGKEIPLYPPLRKWDSFFSEGCRGSVFSPLVKGRQRGFFRELQKVFQNHGERKEPSHHWSMWWCRESLSAHARQGPGTVGKGRRLWGCVSNMRTHGSTSSTRQRRGLSRGGERELPAGCRRPLCCPLDSD